MLRKADTTIELHHSSAVDLSAIRAEVCGTFRCSLSMSQGDVELANLDVAGQTIGPEPALAQATQQIGPQTDFGLFG